MKVLVTGMSGLIGGALRRHLSGNYDLVALNRSDVKGVACHRADIADLDAIRPAFQDVETVVHLSGWIRDDWDRLLPTNVIGTYNVFEASREAGVRRVILASSGSTIAGFERDEPYRALSEGRYADAPDSLKYDIFYAVSNNRWSYRDMEHARTVLGFEAEGSAENVGQ